MHPFQIVRHRKLWLLIGLVAGTLLLGVLVATAQGPKPGQPSRAASDLGTGFSYQGQLKSSGAPVNGTCDFRFALYDALSLGTQVGVTQTLATVSVTGGLFTVNIDFGLGAFTGDARWLDIQTACPSGGGYTALTPRQALTPAPLALALPGLWTQQNATSPNLIGGFSGNLISPTLFGATIGGGGQSGYPNRAWNDYATVGGGVGNTASGIYATVGGGRLNTASNDDASVGGGYDNTASGNGATVGGGDSNTASGGSATIGGGYNNTASNTYATIGGGYNNTASGTWATVGGGYTNTASGQFATVAGGNTNLAAGVDATVSGGTHNKAINDHATVGGGFGITAGGFGSTVAGGYDSSANGDRAAVGGGYGNTASGQFATVPGGDFNSATMTNTLAAGHRAKANHQGSFVWADSTDTDFVSNAPNQYLVRAAGGVTLWSNAALTMGCSIPAGGGSWNCTSDRSAKMNFGSVDGHEVLARLASIPVETWSYKTQDASIRHIGPMAQDFHAAFGVGENETTISTVDAQGVAFAAIQGLYEVVQEKDAQIATQQKQISELQKQNASVEARLTALEERANIANPAANGRPVLLALGTLVMLGVVYRRHRSGHR